MRRDRTLNAGRHADHMFGQRINGKWLRHHLHAGFKEAVSNDGALGLVGHEEYFQIGSCVAASRPASQ